MERSELVRHADAALVAAQEFLERAPEQLRARAAPSAWNAAQHLEHLSLAAQHSLNAVGHIRGGHGEPRAGKADVMARRVLRSGTIPRGAQAPERTHPTAAGDLDAARRTLESCRASLRELESAELGTGTLPHPILGPLDALEWLRFVDVHTQHHLAQIRGMLA